MSAPTRLLSVRLQGFKSFAERTVVEFGSGISAIVGPNGAGKSNLADALRWALGEQGRALRSRRSEDIIFAGSEARPALGMADVVLAIENGDGLLPIEYSVVELGRRLFRSGENEYLLNGTRVRLRDLEELLDAAHLAENAFLFIGQGMVDQALALRPQERRPLFTEVAGVRRHERRKQAAEARLAEAEANLARVRDVLAELRPQARRLAAQAEQQVARGAAGDALGGALVAVARARWHEGAARLTVAAEGRSRGQAEIDAVLGELRAADDEVEEVAAGLDRGQGDLGAARGALDEARAELLEARVAEARLEAEREALRRDRVRLETERAAIAERVAAARRRLALPTEQPAPSGAATDPPVRLASPADSAVREEEAGYRAALQSETEAREAHGEAAAALVAAARAVERAAEEAVARRGALAVLSGEERVAEDQLAAANRSVTRLATTLESLDARLGEEDRARPAGSLVTGGLEVEARLRPAVEAALGVAVRGAVVRLATLSEAGAGGAPLVIDDMPARRVGSDEGTATMTGARDAGGGHLSEAVHADSSGVARRLLERAVWVPDLVAALALAKTLLPGWIVTTPRGDALDWRGVLSPAPEASLLALRTERARVSADLETARAAARDAEESLSLVAARRSQAQSAADDAAREAVAREGERRAALETEADAARRLELATREAAWARAQLTRRRPETAGAAGGDDPGAGWDRQSGQAAERQAIGERRRLEGSIDADMARAAAVAAEMKLLASQEATHEGESARQGALVAELAARVDEHMRVVRELELGGDALRRRLQAAEGTGRAARERLRLGETHVRALERDELEARLFLDGVREQLLVELAGLGAAGLRVLGAGDSRAASTADDEAIAPSLEAAIDALTPGWAALPPPGPPTPTRLAGLRRRFHELGAANPFAVEEHAELQERLSALEAQRDDLERAIAATRRLIADLERLISEQFQATFRALETAFGRRFEQLFDGGSARLALTDVEVPEASGVEIIARPPGKKAQPLSMLSGGERALTAVALLFAMLEVRPVPFCVLDEVDAALDEANIGRFASALRELAATIQFVVITHNRGTIEQADALYGVTIGDDAVSRIISLRLGEEVARGVPAVSSAGLPIERS